MIVQEIDFSTGNPERRLDLSRNSDTGISIDSSRTDFGSFRIRDRYHGCLWPRRLSIEVSERLDSLANNDFSILMTLVIEPISSNALLSHIPNGSLLADQLFAIITAALSMAENPVGANLGCLSFKTLLEASLHSREVLKNFSENEGTSMLLQMLLLNETTSIAREDAANAIRALCCTLPS